jgi:hypothetical protein
MEDPDHEVLGDSLIPVINRLQDIFSQVGGGAGDPRGRDLGDPRARGVVCAPRRRPGREAGAPERVGAGAGRAAASAARRADAPPARPAPARAPPPGGAAPGGAGLRRAPTPAPPPPPPPPCRQVTLDFKLALPQVAVVGSQSSGKSSVLEALVRPRGFHGEWGGLTSAAGGDGLA